MICLWSRSSNKGFVKDKCICFFFSETKTVTSILNLLLSLSVKFVQKPFMVKTKIYLLKNKGYDMDTISILTITLDKGMRISILTSRNNKSPYQFNGRNMNNLLYFSQKIS